MRYESRMFFSERRTETQKKTLLKIPDRRQQAIDELGTDVAITNLEVSGVPFVKHHVKNYILHELGLYKLPGSPI